MIAVTRSGKPEILKNREQSWLNALNKAVTEEQKKQAANKYRHPQVKQALDTMFHGKCAYCESKIKHVSYPHIEHYRPKSKYPHLTFEWTNLLLGCGICNSAEFKGDNFPEAEEGGPYIDPCVDDPDEHFDFLYDPNAKLTSVYGKTERGRKTEGDLGLNRQELRTQRSIQVTRLAFVALHALTDPKARALLEEAKRSDAEYAAFARILPTSR